jgi:nitroreductase
MANPANPNHTINDLLRERYSARAYSDQPIERETLLSLLEAARWSPSSNNKQPWHFIVATEDDSEAYEKIFNLLKAGNQRWAGSAPVLALVVAYVGTEDKSDIAIYDVGQSVAHLTVEAVSHGVMLRQMGGIYKDKAKEAYNIPEGYEVLVALAMGYPEALENLPEDVAEREQHPRVRKPLTEFVFRQWNETSPLLTTESITLSE